MLMLELERKFLRNLFLVSESSSASNRALGLTTSPNEFMFRSKTISTLLVHVLSVA